MPLPLEGFKVLDFTHVISGPLCTRNLALLGADVVKIESPVGGDAMRYIGNREDCAGQSPYFLCVNADKRSILVNLKSPDGIDVILRLAASCDILVENFRPGVLSRLGLGYDAVRAVAPKIIYCSISGYGQAGPWRDYPAYDNVVQAISGIMSTSGEEGDAPMQVGFAPSDSFAGQLATQAILAAAVRRERFGEGELIDVSMLDASLVLMVPVAGPHLISGEPISRRGNRGFGVWPGTDLFPTREGFLMMAAYTDAHFASIWTLIGRDELKGETRLGGMEGRARNEPEIGSILREALMQRTALEWEPLLNQVGVPATAMRDVPTVVSEPHVRGRQLLQPLDVPGASRHDLEVFGLGYEMSGVPPRVPASPPLSGEHTTSILEEAGYTAAEIEALRGIGAVA